MASNGIVGRVAVVAMGCSHFGERFDTSTEDLILEAYQECLSGTGLTPADIDAYWLGTLGSGMSGLTLSRALGSDDKPVTRVENMCASGSEAFRNACYAVASGAYDIAMAVGVGGLLFAASCAWVEINLAHACRIYWRISRDAGSAL